MIAQLQNSPRRSQLRRWLRVGAASGVAAGLMLVSHNPSLAQKADGAQQVTDALSRNQVALAVSAGEEALAQNPRDAALRAALGRAYMRNGRFESAAAVLADAQALGDNSPRTALNLALAQTAIGKGHDAIEVLDAARSQLPVADYGLAVALAGDSARGVAVLTDALRQGDNSPRLHQNLGYAFALDGRWADARTAVAADLPSDQVDTRITQWAANAQPDAYRSRVAAMLNAPLHNDAGLPAALALNAAPAARMASAEPAPAPVPVVAEAAPEPAPKSATAPAPAAAPVPVVAEATPQPQFIATPVVQSARAVAHVAPRVAVARPAAPHFAQHHIVAPHFAQSHFVAPHSVAPHFAMAQAHRPAPYAGHGTRAVQLGSFSSKAAAAQARAHFAHNAAFAHHPFVITPVQVHGHSYWRVAVTGFGPSAANGTCASLRAHGGACFAYAAVRAPGNVAVNRPALAIATPHSPMRGGGVAHAHKR